MTLMEVIKQCGARVSGGSEYLWDCYGPNARYMEFVDVAGSEYAHVIHDTKTHEVYEFALTVPGQDQAFVWRNSETASAYLAECRAKNVKPNQAWDDVYYAVTDEDTIMQYAKDIGEMYYDDLPVPENA